MSAEVKPGYKRTEAGVIPIDWDTNRFGEIALLERGKFSARPRNDPKYFGGQTPFIQTGDVTNSNGFVTDYSQTLNEAGLTVSKVFKKDTLFFTIAANIGDVAFAAFDAACPDSLIGITPKFSSINKGWLFHELRSRKHNFEGLATQNAQLNINLEKLNPYQLPIPPLKEQEAIASALSDMDILISSLDQLIAKRRDIQQATMQQLLTGQRRLPRFSGEWSRHVLRDLVCMPVTDGPHETPRFVENGIPFLSVNNIANNRIDFRDLRFISREDHLIYSKKCRPQRNDLLLGKAASVGKVALIETDVELNIWSPIALIRMSDVHDPRYFYYAFRSKEIGRQIEVLTNSSSQGNIGMGDIEKLFFSVPNLAEQTAIASLLSDMDAELAAIEARRDKARQLKQGMMQELLTGRIRLA